jgi:hypothetical protein
MLVTTCHTTSTRVFGALIGIALLVSNAAAQVATVGGQWTARADSARSANGNTFHRPTATSKPGPLARLVHNPDSTTGRPPYALADQSGTIQRYVEPVPGIDLEPYVGYAVIVRHDTGQTLLATQLELPSPNSTPPSDEPNFTDFAPVTPSGRSASALERFVSLPDDARQVQPAQYMQGMQYAPGTQYAPGMQGQMQPVYIQPQAGPNMMTPQGVVPMEQMPPGMAGGEWGGYPSGAGPIYLDDPNACGPQGCPTGPTPQMQTFSPMQAYQPYQQCQTCPPVTAPPPPPLRWSAWGEVLWLHPTGVDMAHAQQQDGIGGAGTVPFGNIGVVDPDYDLGFRIGGEFRFAPTGSVFGNFTWFDSGTASGLVAPVIVGGGGAVGSLVHHPGAALTASAGPVNATYDVDFQLGDLAYRYFVICRPDGEVSVFFGGRYANLDQNFSQTGIFGGGLGGTVDTTTSIDFTGAGPMVGITGEHLIGDSRFSAYARALAAALTGEFQSRYTMFNSTTATTLAQSFWNDDRIVPMLDYELGIAWTGPKGRVRVAAGYLASFWFNAVSTPVFVDAVQADNYVNVTDTIAFDGLVGHVEFRW